MALELTLLIYCSVSYQNLLGGPVGHKKVTKDHDWHCMQLHEYETVLTKCESPCPRG